MGNAKSKFKGALRSKNSATSGQNGVSGSPGTPDTKSREEEYEDIELLLLRRAIQRDPESFVLNNLMMCIQFFDNYEEEMDHVKETLVSSREAELNKNLPPQKHILLPDVLQEHVARNVGFTSSRQTFRPTVEPLQPVRIYVVHDNVDVTQQQYSPHYSRVHDGAMYGTLLKPTEHQGYVQLQLVEETPILGKLRKEEEVDLSSIAEDDDNVIYSEAESIYGPKPSFVLTRRPKRDVIRNALHAQSRSLPDLHDERIMKEDRGAMSSDGAYKTRSSQNVKFESDYDHASSTEERHECRRYRRFAQRKKAQTFGQEHSRASSTSSGYRSGNYAVDSDSSCNACQRRSDVSQGRTSINSDSCASKSSSNEELDRYSIENAELPSRCFKKVTYTPDGKIYDPREERKQLLNSKQRRIKLALRRHNYNVFYASSNEFMRYFVRLFVDRLAEPLGFDREAIEDVRREGCVVYCDKVMVSRTFRHSRVEQYEIIPAIWLEWPHCAQEWLDRPRSTWPDYGDVEKIKDFGCYVVPEGFVPKRGNNLIQDLEWQLTFPAAERYLETCMTQAQAKVYLIALMLHKTFMRPVFDTMFGMTTAHIRNKLFWMIEENDRPSKWPDNRTGECLLTLLNSLYHNISQNEPTLRDYFVRERNLFQRVPSDHLLHTQKQIKRIIENPVMYVFHAMENIRHSDQFFPRLDYEMLLKILTIDALALINPAIQQHISRPVPTPSPDYVTIQDERYGGTEGFWDNVKKQKNQRNSHSTTTVTNKTLINPRKATDSIIEISVRCAELEGPRLSALLDFFVRHFIKMAERCHQYRAHRQKNVYLDQADRLSILLSDHARHREDARAYRDKVKALRKRRQSFKSQDNPPETPKRNAEQPIFTAPLKTRTLRDTAEVTSTMTSNNQQQQQQLRSLYSESGVQNPVEPPVEPPARLPVVREVQFREEDARGSNDGNSTNDSNEGRATTNLTENLQRPVLSLVDNSDQSFLTETTYI